MGTAIRFFFGYTVYPLALPFSASFGLSGDNRGPPALMPVDAETTRSSRSIPDKSKEWKKKEERSLGTRAYARVAYERCVSRSAGMKWLSFNFTAPREPTTRSNTNPTTPVTIITETCHSLWSRVFWGYLAREKGK
jgi:hypothetical protein